MNMDAWLIALLVVLVMGFITWLYSLVRKDVSIVDSLWSLMFLTSAIVYVLFAETINERTLFIFALIALWALRLSIFLTVRNWGQQEDRRYQAIRANNEPFWIKSLYIVFGLQAVLAWFISVSLLVALDSASEFSLLDAVATILWLIGFLFEAIADWQLYRFQRNPGNAGKVLDTGLWRYSRHPNYFGESLIWWAYFLFAINSGVWWIVISPVLMTVLLLKVSGVALMEKDISERRARYRDYIRSTNAFIPWLPKALNKEIGGSKHA